MKKIIVSLLGCLFIVILLNGCNGRVKMQVINKLSEEQIKQEIIKYIREKYNDTVTIELMEKKKLSVAKGYFFDGPLYYKKVNGAHSYHFEVTPVQYPDLHIRVNYNDAYISTENGKTVETEAFIQTSYDEDVAIHKLYLGFKDILKKYDEGAFTMQMGQQDNFIAAVLIKDFNKIRDLHDELYSFLHTKGDMGTMEIKLYLFRDSSIDFSKLRNKELIANNLKEEYNTIKGLELGETERFVKEDKNTILEFKEFIEKWANLESTWSIPSEIYEGTEIYFMNRKYEDYKYIIILDSFEPNKHYVSLEAWGIY